MASRVATGARPGGARFAQFKLVLLGEFGFPNLRAFSDIFLGESAVGKV